MPTTHEGEPTLYHMPPSFFSQIARITLAEKGVRYRSRYVIAGPPSFDNYAPWYVRLNPGCTVPTLVDGDQVFADSDAIIRHVDASFPGPALLPAAPALRAEAERWIAALRALSPEVMTYGSGLASRVGGRINGARLRNLHAQAAATPDLEATYRAKIAHIEGFAAAAADPARVEAERAKARATLDALEERLAARPWIAGDAYTLADAVWTVGVARLVMIGLEPLAGRPHLARWYTTVRARPSFRGADIWERFHPTALLRVMLSRLGERLRGRT